MHRRQALLAAAFAVVIAPALAPLPALAQSAMADGEVVKIDKAGGRVTIKHNGVPNLGMPPMLMVFHVRDSHMLDDLAVGDRVRFAAERIDGRYTITALSKAPTN